MPTNANTFNSRVTSESLEKKFRDTFPSQGGAELVQDLFASGVIVPTVDFTAAAEGSALRSDLQSAWDFSTGYQQVNSSVASFTLITNSGFWKVQTNANWRDQGLGETGNLFIDDGASTKIIWEFTIASNLTTDQEGVSSSEMVVFLRAGDSLKASCVGTTLQDVVWRQIADVNGNLVNPLGFVSQ